MKVQVKTLKGKNFYVDVEGSMTVADFKGAIEAAESLDASSLKIIFAGKVLKDDQTCDGVGLKEGDFVVCMVSKKKKPSVASAPAPAPAAAPSPAPAPVAPPAPPTAATPAPAPSSGGGASDLIGGAALEAAIRQMRDEMGFPEDQVRKAMRAAFNNADRAAEYLINGIPAGTPAPAPPVSTPAPAAPPASSPAPTSSGSDPLAAVRNHPSIPQLRQLLAQNPAQLPAVLQQIGEKNPELLRLIRENREAFVELLNESPAPTAGGSGGRRLPPGATGIPNPQMLAQTILQMSDAQKQTISTQLNIPLERLTGLLTHMAAIPAESFMALLRGNIPAGGGGGGGMGGIGAPQRVTLTAAEKTSVDRLVDMGFSRGRAIEAFMACDKNEELAANFLFDNP